MAIEGLSIRLYLDHNAHEFFAIDARREGYSAVIAKEIGYELAADEEHLRWATDHGRAVLTHDLHDYRVLAARWFLEGEDHAGIILAIQPGQSPRGTPYGVLLRRLFRLLETLTADDMVNRVEWLDHQWDNKAEDG